MEQRYYQKEIDKDQLAAVFFDLVTGETGLFKHSVDLFAESALGKGDIK